MVGGGCADVCVCVRAQRYNHWSVCTASSEARVFADRQGQVMKMAVVMDEPIAS